MNVAGVVLCGGRSSRMGTPKAWLPFGDDLMLPRVVRIVHGAVGTVVVVAAPGQDVPPLPAGVRIARDEVEGRGPLGGLAAGLAALEGTADAVYLSSCDVPLLKSEFVLRVVGVLKNPTPRPPPPRGESAPSEPGRVSGAQEVTRAFTPSPRGGGGRGVGSADPLIAVPRVGSRLHPLAAAYRVGVLPVVRELLTADRLRMTDLLDAVPTRFIEADELADIDPEFHSLRNVNTPDEYAAALRALDSP